MNDQEMELIVRRVLSELGVGAAVATTEDDEIPDIRQVDYRMTYDVAHPANPERFAQVKARTWARLGLGRSGPRYTTSALLRFGSSIFTVFAAKKITKPFFPACAPVSYTKCPSLAGMFEGGAQSLP